MSLGILLAFISALLLGLYALPSKYTQGFAWENTWGGFFFLANFVIPIILTFTMVDHLWEIYAQIPSWIFFTMFGLSFCWGIGNMLWGYSINSIGMALAFSLFLGVITSIDTILPLILVPEGQETVIGTHVGNIMLTGIAIIVFGIALNGYAGILRDKSKGLDEKNRDSKTIRQGIIFCVIGAICAAGFNLSYHTGNNLGKIGEVAELQFGNEPWIARLAVLLPIFMGGTLSTMLFYGYRLTKNNTWKNYTKPEVITAILLVILMAVFHDSALVLYGLAAYHLGELGTSVGFAILETGAIMIANINGILTKEWKGASKKSITILVISLSILFLGVLIVAKGNYIKIENDKLQETTVEDVSTSTKR
ncbi:L-rhamnose/proton symporter RhaT [Aquimarina agarivorans]|uniref:L-rhamnose/proton symporter RhaT n=1 Tax=Aquimarina agarivorans TaxID=980584 RepID=UPI000248FC7C|nr:L-rhamnose/proton symporter RhaT [Aquimarina agarivorans]